MGDRIGSQQVQVVHHVLATETNKGSMKKSEWNDEPQVNSLTNTRHLQVGLQVEDVTEATGSLDRLSPPIRDHRFILLVGESSGI